MIRVLITGKISKAAMVYLLKRQGRRIKNNFASEGE